MTAPSRERRIGTLLAAASTCEGFELRVVYVAAAAAELRVLEADVERMRTAVRDAEQEVLRRAGPAQKTLAIEGGERGRRT